MKKICTVWLKSVINSRKSVEPRIHTKLTPETRETIQLRIFDILASQKDKTLRRSISALIGEVAGNYFSDCIGKPEEISSQLRWPNLIESIVNQYRVGSKEHMENALCILNHLFLNISGDMGKPDPSLESILVDSLQQKDLCVRVMGVSVLSGLIISLDSKESKKYSRYVGFVLETMQYAFEEKATLVRGVEEEEEDHAFTVLSAIGDIIETDPKVFRDVADELIIKIIKCKSVLTCAEDGVLSDKLVMVATHFAARYPEKFQQDHYLLSSFVEMYFHHLLNVPEVCSEDWMNPPPGFDEDYIEDDSYRIVNFTLELFSKFLRATEPEAAMKAVSEVANSFLREASWKRTFAAFMILSQVGNKMIDSISDLAPIMQLLSDHQKSAEPRIRFSVAHCIGQFSADLEPGFQKSYLEISLSILVCLTEEEKVPRVSGHALYALSNLLKGCEEKQLSGMIDRLFSLLTSKVSGGTTYMAQNALEGISSLAVSSPDRFLLEYYDKTMHSLLEVIERENSKDSRVKHIRGTCIECLSVICEKVGRLHMEPYVGRLLDVVQKIQENEVTGADDPQRMYLLNAWPRVIKTMETDFEKHVSRLVPSLLKICESVGMNQPKIEDSEDTDDESRGNDKAEARAKTYYEEEAGYAIEVIDCLLRYCPAAMSVYYNGIIGVIEPLMGYKYNAEIRTSASGVLPAVMKSYVLNGKTLSLEKVFGFSEYVLCKVWAQIDQENSASVISNHVRAIEGIIENGKDCFDEARCFAVYEKVKKCIRQSDERKARIIRDEDEDEDEELIIETLNDEKDTESLLQLNLAEVLGKLFQVSPASSISIFPLILNELIIPNLLKSESEYLEAFVANKFGIFLIDDALDHLNGFLNKELLQLFYTHLKKFSKSMNTSVKQAAVYGIASFVKHIGKDSVYLSADIFKCLTDSISHSENKNKENSTQKKLERVAIENSLAGICALLKEVQYELPVEQFKYCFDYWLMRLPLVNDPVEAVPQHQYLLDMIKKNREVVLSSQTHLEKVLNVFSIIWKTQYSDDEIDQSITGILRMWKEDQAIVKAMEDIKMTEKNAIRLRKAIEDDMSAYE